MRILGDELPSVDITVSSDYSPDLADALARRRLDVAFLRAEPGFDLEYTVVRQEPLIVLMPSDHPLTSQEKVRPQDLLGNPFVGMANKARVLRGVIDLYLEREGIEITPTQGVDNPAVVMSLVSSTRGLALIPDYVKNLLPLVPSSADPSRERFRPSTWLWATAGPIPLPSSHFSVPFGRVDRARLEVIEQDLPRQM